MILGTMKMGWSQSRGKKHRGRFSPAGLGTGSRGIVDVGMRVAVKAEGKLAKSGRARRNPSGGLKGWRSE